MIGQRARFAIVVVGGLLGLAAEVRVRHRTTGKIAGGESARPRP